MVFLKLDNDGGLLVLPRIRTFSIVKAKNKKYTYKTRRFGGENRLRHQAPGNKMHNRATRIPRWMHMEHISNVRKGNTKESRIADHAWAEDHRMN